MVLDTILVVLGLVSLFAASIIDIKTREVPDLISYGLIISGSFIRLFDAIIYSNWHSLLTTFLGFLALFVIANLMYYSKQWGGGDAKLLMGLSIVFAQYPSSLLKFFSPKLGPFPFVMTLFINILIIGSIYGILFSFLIALKNKEKFVKEYRLAKKDGNTRLIKLFSFLLAVLFIILIFLVDTSLLSILTVSVAVFLVLFPYLLDFVRVVEKSSMFTMLDVKKLTEGDWVAHDIIIKDKKIYSSKSPGITKAQIQELRHHKIKSVLVKEGIPFVPSFFLAVVFTLVIGNPIPI